MSTETVTRSFSLPREVVEFLDTLPNREKSKFVSAHLSRAVQYQKKIRLAKELRNFHRIKDDSEESAKETLKRVRKGASERMQHKIKGI